ncbi:hypothetical protein PilKf_00707 [Pillotina sp. SPG140]
MIALSAQESSRGDYLKLKVAVMGPGSELYFWWGHIALVIEDSITGKETFYDYGLFSFENEHFFTNFAMGRLLYSSGASQAERNFNVYKRSNRDIKVYTLDVDSESALNVLTFVQNSILPENRDYFYHHFYDNCSTRVRDILDIATNGQFKAQYGDAAGRFTFRQHIRRYMWFSPLIDWFLNFLMGQTIDQPITVWEEMFLPAEVGRAIEAFRYDDGQETPRSLVSFVEVLNTAVGRRPILESPRPLWPYSLVVGIIVAVLLLVCEHLKTKKPSTQRVIFGISHSILGFLFGTAGTVLYFMTFFTDHDYTYHNINVLLAGPILLLAIPFGITVARGIMPRKAFFARHMLKALWSCGMLGCLLSLLIRISPRFYQQNQTTQALLLPIALALSFVPDWVKYIYKQRKSNPAANTNI